MHVSMHVEDKMVLRLTLNTCMLDTRVVPSFKEQFLFSIHLKRDLTGQPKPNVTIKKIFWQLLQDEPEISCSSPLLLTNPFRDKVRPFHYSQCSSKGAKIQYILVVQKKRKRGK